MSRGANHHGYATVLKGNMLVIRRFPQHNSMNSAASALNLLSAPFLMPNFNSSPNASCASFSILRMPGGFLTRNKFVRYTGVPSGPSMLRTALYSRKSLEDDDRQVQSIESQQNELRPIAAKRNLSVMEVFGEAQSAKAPGRPKFNQMMAMVNRGEIDTILCWKLDRLARNPIDGAAILWAIKTHGLTVITPQQTFSQAEDNQILMYIEFGMAQKYIDDLGRNTKRGLKAKAEKGWYPGVAPVGYLNSKTEERGQKTILVDPERFPAVRRMWDLMLSGNHKPTDILRIANEEWGFRTRPSKRTGGKPLSRSTLYKLFSDPFYCGRYEYPKGSGAWHQGKHEPMVTKAEFEAVRMRLSADAPTRPFEDAEFAFAGLFRCGECGSRITGHSKVQVRCTRCRNKSSFKNRQVCSKCNLSLGRMKSPQIRRYAYYHCTRTLNPACRQRAISREELEKQVGPAIAQFSLPEVLKNWGLDYIESLRADELRNRQDIMAEKRKRLERCRRQLANLLKLKTSPENVNGILMTDEEYSRQRCELLAEQQRLSRETNGFEANLERKAAACAELLHLAASIGSPADTEITRSREVLRALGSNHVIFAKKLEIKPDFPFSELPPLFGAVDPEIAPIEPENTQEKPGWNGDFQQGCPSLVRDSDENRTSALQSAMQKIWKRLDVDNAIFKRSSFEDEPPAVPKLKRIRWNCKRRKWI